MGSGTMLRKARHGCQYRSVLLYTDGESYGRSGSGCIDLVAAAARPVEEEEGQRTVMLLRCCGRGRCRRGWGSSLAAL